MRALDSKKQATDVISHDVTPITVNTDAGAYSRLGWIIVLFGVGGFLLWAMLAPLDKGVPLAGTVTKESNRQAVQHLTGGTIQEILVKDGDVVKAGQVLVRMNPIQATSAANVMRAQYLTAKATEARLLAERDGAKQLTFPAELQATGTDPHATEVRSLQSQLFNSRQMSLQSELGAIDENIAGLKLQISSLQELRQNQKVQLDFLKEQLGGMRDLAKDGYIARNRLLDVERTYAQVNGSISENIGQIGRLQRQVAEMSLRRIQRTQDYQKEVRTQLAEIQREAEAMGSRLTAASYELANVDVKAPAAGVVVGLAVFTKGGVVPAGFRLMDIVPSGDPLVVEGHLAVTLVDKVHPGLPVDVMFSAFNTNTTPHIPGEVTQVSADRSVDERTGEPYYKIRVRVTPEGAKLIAKHKLDIQAGMPADLFVKTGERTMMNYLVKPIMDRARSTLSED
ncbi:MAG: HlyD family type I secretion periplasmic adaptor subunit [Telluria sp.]